MSSDFEVALWQLIAHVDQRSAEYKDPDTTDERKAELYAELKELYDMLVKIQKHENR